jgi:hypothetical protein
MPQYFSNETPILLRTSTRDSFVPDYLGVTLKILFDIILFKNLLRYLKNWLFWSKWSSLTEERRNSDRVFEVII